MFVAACQRGTPVPRSPCCRQAVCAHSCSRTGCPCQSLAPGSAPVQGNASAFSGQPLCPTPHRAYTFSGTLCPPAPYESVGERERVCGSHTGTPRGACGRGSGAHTAAFAQDRVCTREPGPSWLPQNYLSETGGRLAGLGFPPWRNWGGGISPKEFWQLVKLICARAHTHTHTCSLTHTHTHTEIRRSVCEVTSDNSETQSPSPAEPESRPVSRGQAKAKWNSSLFFLNAGGSQLTVVPLTILQLCNDAEAMRFQWGPYLEP